jgi:hypothetical protein
MRTKLVATLVLFVGLAVGETRADPYTPYFEPVRVKVVALLDGLSDPQTKQEAKRKALLEKILAALDKVSASLKTDLATGKAVAAAVVKGFLDDPELPDVVLDVLTSLEGDLRARAQTLSARLSALPDSKAKRKVQKSLAKVDKPLSSADAAEAVANLKKMAAALTKADSAATTLERALVRAEAASGLPCLGVARGSATATVDGAAYDVDPLRITAKIRRAAPTSSYDPKVLSVTVEFFQTIATSQGPNVDPAFAFYISQDSPAGEFHGVGTYDVGSHSVAAVEGNFRAPGLGDRPADSGTLTLTEFDLDTKRIAGSISFDARPLATEPPHPVSAQFTVTCIEFIDP